MHRPLISQVFKTSVMLLFFGLIIISCRHETGEQANRGEEDRYWESENFHPKVLEQRDDPVLHKWSQFYQQVDTAFRLAAFVPDDSVTVSPMKGTIKSVNDPDFDPLYSEFLIYAPDNSRYIDIDSYLWRLNASGDLDFEVDQEINLVDVETDSITRVGFLGPSYRIEEVVWLDESHILLLGNQEGNQPYLQQLDLNTFQGRIFRYPTKIHSKKDYYLQRIQSLLKKK